MASPKRADIIAKAAKVLAKHYKPIKPVDRTLLENLVYAACLEDSKATAADEGFARLQESFFDWNEVRVTTVRELSEMLRGLTDPLRAATMVKHTLHSVFESIYEFDLESLKKQNLGVAVKQLEQYRGTSPFTVSYAVQNSLGGHSIPVSHAGFEIMQAIEVLTPKEAEKGSVPGLERAIPKNKGSEFGSLLQQLSAEYAATPFGTNVRSIICEISPSAKERLPKRGAKKQATPEKKSVSKKSKDEEAAEEAAPKKKKVVKQAEATSEKPKKKKKVKKTSAGDKTTEKTAKKTVKKKTKKKVVKKTGTKKAAKKTSVKKANKGAKKSTSKQLARRKPR